MSLTPLDVLTYKPRKNHIPYNPAFPIIMIIMYQSQVPGFDSVLQLYMILPLENKNEKYTGHLCTIVAISCGCITISR